MSIDQSLIYAKRFETDPTPLKQAVLGASPQGLDIDPYTALRALQHIDQSRQMQMAQQAQQAPMANAQPSIADAELAKAFGTGGIVAFAHGGVPHFDGEEESLVKEEEGVGDHTVMDPYMERIRGIQSHVIDKDADNSAIANEMRRAQSIMGRGDPYAEFRSKLAKEEAGSEGELEKGKGLAMLQAAGAILEPGGLARGLGKAGQAFGAAYNDVLKADRAAKQARDQMRFHLTDAERKEKLGLYRDAAASIAAGHANAIKGQQFEVEKIKAEGTLAAAQARLKGKPGAGSFDVNALNAKTEAYIKGGMDPVKAKEKAANDILSSKQQKNIFSVSDIAGNKAEQGAGELNRKITADERKQLTSEILLKYPDYFGLSPEEKVIRENQIIAKLRSQAPGAKSNPPKAAPAAGGNYTHLWE